MWIDDERFYVGGDTDDTGDAFDSDDTDDMFGGLPDMWVAHDQPERPLAYGAWLCDCQACRHSLETAARCQPKLVIVLKTSADRIVVSAGRAVQEWQECGALEGLLLLAYDYIREVFVGEEPPRGWNGEFWSLNQAMATPARRPGRRSRKHR